MQMRDFHNSLTHVAIQYIESRSKSVIMNSLRYDFLGGASLRIAIFTNAYHPIVSGVVTAISLFRRGLEAAGHEVAVFAPAFDDYRDEEAQVYRYPALDLTRKVKFPVAIPFSQQVAQRLREFNPDIIHTHHPFVLGQTAQRAAVRLNIPLVYTFHTQYEQYAHYIPLPAPWVRWMTRNTIRNFACRVDLLTTPAASVAEILTSYGIDKPIHILTNPIDLSRYRQNGQNDLRDKLGIHPEEKVLLYVGRMGLEKNLRFMLEAFALVKAQCKNYRLRLLMVGDGPERASLQVLAVQLGVAEDVLLPGAVNYTEIPSYFQSADLFLMTSTSEVKPLVLIEAMAASLPIVAVNANGSRDTVTHGKDGLLTPLDREAFSHAVSDLLQDEPRCKAMGEAAGYSAESYGLNHVTNQLIALYHEAKASKFQRRAVT